MWISSQVLPERGTSVLVYSPGGDIVAVASLEQRGDELYWETDNDELAASPASAVTHWMPLPPRPSSVD